MRVLAARESPELRVRLLECDCGLEGCESVFVVVQQPGAHEELWLGMGVVLEGYAAAETAAAELLRDPHRDLGFRTAKQMIERGIAMVGLTWPRVSDRSWLEAQIGAWGSLPEWMERQPAGRLWAIRGVVFGHELTRVVRALEAEDYYYVPDLGVGGVAGYVFDQPQYWGVQHPEAWAPPWRWYARPGGAT